VCRVFVKEALQQEHAASTGWLGLFVEESGSEWCSRLNRNIQPPPPHAVGTHAVGTHAVGTHAVGTHAVGTNAVGTHAVGTHAVGTHAVGIHNVAGIEARPCVLSSVWWQSSWLALVGLKPDHVCDPIAFLSGVPSLTYCGYKLCHNAAGFVPWSMGAILTMNSVTTLMASHNVAGFVPWSMAAMGLIAAALHFARTTIQPTSRALVRLATLAEASTHYAKR
jgi:hypothetical protein